MIFEVKPAMMKTLVGFTTGSPATPELKADGTLALTTQVGMITLDADETALIWEEFVKRQKRLWPSRGHNDRRR